MPARPWANHREPCGCTHLTAGVSFSLYYPSGTGAARGESRSARWQKQKHGKAGPSLECPQRKTEARFTFLHVFFFVSECHRTDVTLQSILFLMILKRKDYPITQANSDNRKHNKYLKGEFCPGHPIQINCPLNTGIYFSVFSGSFDDFMHLWIIFALQEDCGLQTVLLSVLCYGLERLNFQNSESKLLLTLRVTWHDNLSSVCRTV